MEFCKQPAAQYNKLHFDLNENANSMRFKQFAMWIKGCKALYNHFCCCRSRSHGFFFLFSFIILF